MTTNELIAKLTIWQQDNPPETELVKLAIERLEQLNEKIAKLEDDIDFMLGTSSMP